MLAVLMLRGPQTPGELKQRGDRLHRLPDLGVVHDALDRLIERGNVVRIDRQPGQKEERYAQLLGGGEEGPAAEATKAPPGDRLERLERELADLRDQVRQLREEIDPSD